MKLGFKTNLFILAFCFIGLLFSNSISMVSCSFNLVSLPEIAANDVSQMAKENNGYVRVDFVSRDTNYLSVSRENVYSVSSFRQGNSSFVTFGDDFFDFKFVDKDFRIPVIGLTNQKNNFLPLQMMELDYSNGNYLKHKDQFIGKNGCVLSKQLADKISTESNIHINNLIGKEIVESNHNLSFTIISIVEDKCFASSCFSELYSNGFMAADFSALARIKKCNFHLFLTDEYNQNFSIFYKTFSSIYHINSLPYLEITSPSNSWFAQEINAFITGNNKSFGNSILLVSEIFFVLISIIMSFLILRMRSSLLPIKSSSNTEIIIFSVLFLLVSIAISFLTSKMVIFGFHINARSSTSYTISLINFIIILMSFLFVKKIFTSKNKNEEFVECEI